MLEYSERHMCMRPTFVKVVTVCLLMPSIMVGGGCGFSEEYRRASAVMEAVSQARKAREARDRADQARWDYLAGVNYFGGRGVAKDAFKGVPISIKLQFKEMWMRNGLLEWRI